MNSVHVIEADLSRPEHQQAVLAMVDAYATDPMGDGKPLAERVKQELILRLREHPTTIIFLAYDGAAPVGIAVCFLGFSTFAARPLINIHDLSVLPSHRERGVGRLLLAAVEEKARATDCCKLTLEVGTENRVARRVYEAAGFSQGLPSDSAGRALFYTKRL